MEKGIQIGNEIQSKEIFKMQTDIIKDILNCENCEEETKRKALDTLARLSVVENISISHNKIIENT